MVQGVGCRDLFLPAGRRDVLRRLSGASPGERDWYFIADYCAPCQPLLRAFSGWVRSSPDDPTCALVQKEAYCHKMPPFCGGVQRGVTLLGCEMNVGTMVQQHLDDCVVATRSGAVQRRGPALDPADVDIRALV